LMQRRRKDGHNLVVLAESSQPRIAHADASAAGLEAVGVHPAVPGVQRVRILVSLMDGLQDRLIHELPRRHNPTPALVQLAVILKVADTAVSAGSYTITLELVIVRPLPGATEHLGIRKHVRRWWIDGLDPPRQRPVCADHALGPVRDALKVQRKFAHRRLLYKIKRAEQPAVQPPQLKVQMRSAGHTAGITAQCDALAGYYLLAVIRPE